MQQLRELTKEETDLASSQPLAYSCLEGGLYLSIAILALVAVLGTLLPFICKLAFVLVWVFIVIQYLAESLCCQWRYRLAPADRLVIYRSGARHNTRCWICRFLNGKAAKEAQVQGYPLNLALQADLFIVLKTDEAPELVIGQRLRLLWSFGHAGTKIIWRDAMPVTQWRRLKAAVRHHG